MPSQLRRYTINRGKLGDFVAAWKNGVYPLRTKMGYRIQAWTIKERSEFVWITSLPPSQKPIESPFHKG